MAEGDANTALERLANITRNTESTPAIEDEMGFLLAVLLWPHEAIERFRKALVLDPGFAAAHYH